MILKKIENTYILPSNPFPNSIRPRITNTNEIRNAIPNKDWKRKHK